MYMFDFKSVGILTDTPSSDSAMRAGTALEEFQTAGPSNTNTEGCSYGFGARVRLLPPHPDAGRTGVVLNILRFADGTEGVRVGLGDDVINCGTDVLRLDSPGEPNDDCRTNGL